MRMTMQESIFFSEWLAAGRPNNQLCISAVCNSRCLFCSNHLNPFPVHQGVFRDIEEVKHQLTLMEQRHQPLRLSESLPGRISEGEAFLHPRLFDILELVRRRFLKNTLCFTTNASLLDEPFLKQLARFRPIEITVSMHSTRPELWARIFGRSVRDAHMAIDSLGRIRRSGMELIGAIVPLPAICGWADIERTFDHFAAHGAKQMILWHPGYSVRTPPEIIGELQCPPEEYLDFAERMKARHSIPLTIGNDMRAPLEVAVEKIIARTGKGNIRTLGGPYRRVIWLTSAAAYARLDSLVAEHAAGAANRHQVFPVPNRTYGGNISVAGLLMTDDFVEAGRQALAQYPDTELFLVPIVPFDSLYRDLCGRPAHSIAEGLNKPVWVVGDNGGYETLLSGLFTPQGETWTDTLQKTMGRFNALWRSPRQTDRDALLAMIAGWPLETGAGMLDREQFLSLVADENERLGANVMPSQQRFEWLDDARALCMERWNALAPGDSLNKWTFWVKGESIWRVERLLRGGAADGQGR